MTLREMIDAEKSNLQTVSGKATNKPVPRTFTSGHGGTLTPWGRDVDANGHKLVNVAELFVGDLTVSGKINGPSDAPDQPPLDSLTVTGDLIAGDQVIGASAVFSGDIHADGQVVAASAQLSGDLAVDNVNATGTVAAASAQLTGDLSVDNVNATGALTAASGQINGDVNITGHYYRGGIQLAISNQNVATASRAAGVVYQNTSGKTMFIVTAWDLGGKNSTIAFLSDTSNPPVTEVNRVSDPSNTAGITHSLFCMVLPNYYYECLVTAGAPVLVLWVEYT